MGIPVICQKEIDDMDIVQPGTIGNYSELSRKELEEILYNK